jgi:Helix-turn-helix of DDE superfamily endonuclease/DDE superfamily endonuclease
MITYAELRGDRWKFLALTGLTVSEFQQLLTAFDRSYERLFRTDRTLAGQPRQRFPGGGRRGVLYHPEQKLLFLLVYLKTYTLQVVLGQLFGISTSQANYWLHHLLPVLRWALDDLGVKPERDGARLARRPVAPPGTRALIIDGTERRRRRPKNAEKQARHYSGKKKTHTDKNVVLTSAADDRVLFLSGTYPGASSEKRIADEARLRYPPGTILYKDAGFQGYEPAVQKTCPAKKKAKGARVNGRGEAGQSPVGDASRPRGARHRRGEAQPDRQGRVSEPQAGVVGYVHGGCLRIAQP